MNDYENLQKLAIHFSYNFACILYLVQLFTYMFFMCRKNIRILTRGINFIFSGHKLGDIRVYVILYLYVLKCFVAVDFDPI